MIVNKTTMLAEILGPLSLHYPAAGYSPEKLASLADDWCEDLSAYSLPVLQEASRAARRNERYFPCVAVFLRYAAAAAVAWSERLTALPVQTHTPEELARNAELSRLLGRKLKGDQGAAQKLWEMLHAGDIDLQW